MPVDKMMLDAMMGTFRTMFKECQDKKLSGDDFNQMEATLNRMEQLGQEVNDIGAFSGQLAQEGLFMKFSDHYGKLLSAEAKQSAAAVASVYDEASDSSLLQQTISAYKNAVKNIQGNKEQTKQLLGANASDADVLFRDKAVTDAIEKVIQLGKSGCTYPQFLSEMIKQGLDKAMEGTALARDGQVYILEATKALSACPIYIKKEEDKLALFDALCNASSASVPNALQYSLGCVKIEWGHQPAINKWNKIKAGWEQSTFWLDEWITSYCSFAPYIAPWAQSRNPHEAVIESQDCVPGKIRAWEKINWEYFNVSLREIFHHESFEWDVKHHWMYWSQAYMEFLLKEVEPVCKPFERPATEMISRAEAFHNDKLKVNPAIGEPVLRYARYFDNYFGEGAYEKRFGLPEKIVTNALPWEFEKFSY